MVCHSPSADRNMYNDARHKYEFVADTFLCTFCNIIIIGFTLVLMFPHELFMFNWLYLMTSYDSESFLKQLILKYVVDVFGLEIAPSLDSYCIE